MPASWVPGVIGGQEGGGAQDLPQHVHGAPAMPFFKLSMFSFDMLPERQEAQLPAPLLSPNKERCHYKSPAAVALQPLPYFSMLLHASP